MEITDYAKQILLSDSLADKLFTPLQFTDKRPQIISQLPSRPARPPKFDFNSKPESAHFPTYQELEKSPQVAGRIFHFFANHELLALELMAWLLLKFEKLDPKLRLGLAQTMVEEQKHMNLYLSEMHKHGIELGDISMGAHFWNILADIKDPREFLAGMSLTFEQANLDFARDWRNHFLKLSMTPEADVMQIVYEEEIGHVKHGLHWLRKMDEEDLSDLALHQRYLPPRLSLRKARGEIVDYEARKRAGFDEQYIQAIELAGGSKSRAPDLIQFKIANDLEWSGHEISAHFLALNQDTASLGALWSSADDFVMAKIPSQSFQSHCYRFLGHNPVWITPEQVLTLAERTPKLRHIHTWSNSPSQIEFKEYLKPLCSSQNKPDLDLNRYWSSKQIGNDLIPKIKIKDSAWELSRGQLHHDVQFLADMNSIDQFMVKTNHSASAQGRLISDSVKPELWSSLVAKFLQHGPVLVEPFFDKKVDLSALFVVENEGVRLMGVTRFETDRRGTWRGSMVSSPYLGLDEKYVKFLRTQVQGQSRMDLWTQELRELITQEMWTQGFRGPLGVDAMILAKNGELYLRPIVEVNARMTFGHLALKLRKKIPKSLRARLRLRRLSSLQKLGETPLSLMEKYQIHEFPLKSHQSGLIPLADPTQIKEFFPVLEIGDFAQELGLT